MKHSIVFLFTLLSTHLLFANDGAYYASGNHLIPITETDISVKKEILTLKKVRNQYIENCQSEFIEDDGEKYSSQGLSPFDELRMTNLLSD